MGPGHGGGRRGVVGAGSFLSSRIPLPGMRSSRRPGRCSPAGPPARRGLASGEAGDLALGDVAGEAWAWLAYLIVIGSIVAFSSYVWLLQNAPISLTATYAYVNPVVAVVLGALVLSEPITRPSSWAVPSSCSGSAWWSAPSDRGGSGPTRPATRPRTPRRPGRVAPDERVVDLPT